MDGKQIVDWSLRVIILVVGGWLGWFCFSLSVTPVEVSKAVKTLNAGFGAPLPNTIYNQESKEAVNEKAREINAKRIPQAVQ